jgi:anthranilate synthase component 1
VPDIVLLLTESLAIIDNLAGKLYLIVYVNPQSGDGVQAAYTSGICELDRLEAKLNSPVVAPRAEKLKPTQVIRDFIKDDYLKAVTVAKEYIAAGDVMQVQIGQVLRKPYEGEPLTLYRALRSINPSPYMYFYDLGDFHVIGASPEILVRQDRIQVEGKPETRVTIRPIAGTRPRGATPDQDLALEKELQADPKERAEHVMLIDLARNDIGRIAQVGSVKVTEQMVVERYSHVMHLVSNVDGLLKPGLTALDVLRASFPAGTLTGAPKIRAMEIIDELEPTKRGLYGGACGYLSFAGDMDLAIAIRTGVLKDGLLHAQAAAGIVADSILENEWLETENKARAMIRAAELAENGLES